MIDALWSRRCLNDQLVEVERLFESITFDEELKHYSLPESEAHWLRNEPYYKGLAGFTLLSGARKVLEIGTLFGGSAIALAMNAELVVAADVDLSRAEPTNLFCRNIVAFPCAGPDDCLKLPLDGVDLIFVDIDHSGRVERQLHERFASEYEGAVFYDDIDLNGGMQGFWLSIELEKVSTKWHHSGFGAVRYPSHSR